MKNIKMTVAYDGTDFLGWQKTDAGLSIEGTLQENLEKILRHPIALQAASRTDAGVHAWGQVVNFFTESEIPLHKLQHSLNCVLRGQIAVREMVQAEKNFHPTLDCKGKEYHYSVCYDHVQLPHRRLYAWHYPYELDVEKMICASKDFIGKKDFSTFCNVQKNSPVAHYIREVKNIEIVADGKNILIKISGNNFLYKMVRNIVGTLVYIGKGKLPEDCIPSLLSGMDRTEAGITAPAHGLSLFQVFY